MEIYWDLKNITRATNSVLTVGTFDGIHLGHQSIIRELRARSTESGGLSTLVTFEPHPQLVIQRKDKPQIKLLTTIDEKIGILKNLGLDRLIIISFTHQFSRMESVDFIREILIGRIGLKEIVIGYDHAFGRDRKGDIKTLKQWGSQYNYTVDVVEPYRINSQVISSTKIRHLLVSGSVSQAARFLGRNYSISGRVVRGEGRGKGLTFPTANIQLSSENKLIPKDGVYAALVKTGGHTYKGILNIGVRPTFTPLRKAIEVHILNFQQELYRKELEVELVERIRDELRFESPQHLIEQMEADREESLRVFANSPKVG